MHYFATQRYENAVAVHSLEFAAQNAMRYRLSATLHRRLSSTLLTCWSSPLAAEAGPSDLQTSHYAVAMRQTVMLHQYRCEQ